jgi:hypothetical protein
MNPIAWRIVLELVRLLSLDPRAASIAAPQLLGAPGWTSEVLDLVREESRGVAVGIHRGHAERVAGQVFWRRAVAAGDLSPRTCPEHQLGSRADAGYQTGDRWGIRGAHGLAAAYSVRYLGDCVAPELLDVPLLSAVVVVRRLEVLEQRYSLRTRPARMEAWRRGPGRQARPAAAAATSVAADTVAAPAPRPGTTPG